MDDDNDVFELFQQIMEQLQDKDPNGRLRMLSKNPRYAADDPAAQNRKTTHIER